MKLRSIPLLLLLTLAAAPAVPQNAAAPQPPPAAPQTAQDLSSPEAAIRSFAAAVNALDVNGVNCLVGGMIAPEIREWAQEARKSGDRFQITILSVQPQVNGDAATATVSFDVSSGGQQKHLEESLSLRKAGADWKIVPPTDAELESFFNGQQKEPRFFAFLTGIYTHPKVFSNAREAAREASCRSNLKQLTNCMLMLMQDKDGRFALRADSFKAAVMPYLKHEAAFHCPSDAAGPVAYSFNAQLQGKSLGAVRKPEVTVMLYEGKKGVLNFRHNGRALVALVDGHVKPVTPAEAKTLRWAP